jgi:Mn2+/Fe2+ NRAMP family transporter
MRVAVYSQQSSSLVNISPQAPGNKTTPPATVTLNRDEEVQNLEYVDMANGWIISGLAWLMWAFIAALNVYLLVMLGLGKG